MTIAISLHWLYIFIATCFTVYLIRDEIKTCEQVTLCTLLMSSFFGVFWVIVLPCWLVAKSSEIIIWKRKRGHYG